MTISVKEAMKKLPTAGDYPVGATYRVCANDPSSRDWDKESSVSDYETMLFIVKTKANRSARCKVWELVE